MAITNDRIVDINETGVRFIHKDYSNGARKKTIELHGVEFLRRFCQHILPHRYVKIRYYGIYSSRFRTLSPGIVKLKVPVKQESSIERIKRLTGVDICRCPVCKIGVMQIIEEIPPYPVARLPSSCLLKIPMKYKLSPGKIVPE